MAGVKRLYNSFWDQPLVDIYQQCRPDVMHSLAIGMDDHIISAIVYTISDSLRIETGETDRTGRAKTYLPWTSIGHIWNNSAQFVLSDYDEHNCGLSISEFVRTRLGKVFDTLPQKPGSMQAVEFETLLLIIPFVLDNLFPEVIVRLRRKGVEYEDKTPGMIRLLVRYIGWRVAIRKAWLSESEVRALRTEAKIIMLDVKACFPRKTGQLEEEAWAIPKFHELLHHGENVLLFGTSENTSCNAGEQKHKGTKRFARRTNQRNVNEQIMSHDAIKNVLGRRTTETSRYARDLVAGGLNALEEAGVRADSERAADRELHVFVEDSLHGERQAPDWRAREKAGKARARRVSKFSVKMQLN